MDLLFNGATRTLTALGVLDVLGEARALAAGGFFGELDLRVTGTEVDLLGFAGVAVGAAGAATKALGIPLLAPPEPTPFANAAYMFVWVLMVSEKTNTISKL